MAIKNSTVIESAWINGSSDFQQRIPNPQISGYAAAVDALFQPYNNDLFNEFSNMLNGMMNTFVESKLFENPLAVLKKSAAVFGNSERHVAVKYLQAHSYKVDDETLLKLEKPEFVEWFYSVTEPRRYEFSWSRYELRRVFNEGDSYAFDDLFTATVTQAYSSDNYDEMNTMIQMFAEADRRMGGLYRENLTAAPTTSDTAKELLVKLRSYAGRLQFPSVYYNHIPVPVHETPETLVLWVTPEVDSVLDVFGLADLFHLERAEVNYRKIVIPEFPIPNVYAALTSEDFIYVRDVVYGMEPPFYNPANMTYKYYLHHGSMIGINPAANAILFTTDSATVIPTVTMEVTGAAFNPNAYEVEAGGSVQTKFALTGTVEGDNVGGKIAVEPDAAIYTVAATRGEDAISLNSRTYVDASGILHVQKTGIQTGDVITITAKSAYINPSGDTETYTATATATVVAPTNGGAKECAVEQKPYIEYTDTTESVTASE